jgi:hypothetical protein
LTTDDCWKKTEKATLEANVVRDMAANILKRPFVKRYIFKGCCRTAKKVEAKAVYFDGVKDLINCTSKAWATGGEHSTYYLDESRAQKQFTKDKGVKVVALPASSGSRQSINVQLPTAILRNF